MIIWSIFKHQQKQESQFKKVLILLLKKCTKNFLKAKKLNKNKVYRLKEFKNPKRIKEDAVNDICYYT